MIFKDRNILITGGSKGIGLAVAREFASRGANLFLTARGAEALAEATRTISIDYPGVKVAANCCDVSDFESVQRTVNVMREQFGEIHGVVNNAGFAVADYFERIEPEMFRRLMEVNYFGSVYTTKAAVPHMKRGSFVAFTSSVAGYVGGFGFTGYSAAKFAVIGFAESLDQELLSRGIQVCVLCPPDTDTPGLAVENESKPFETLEISKRARLMKPEDVARRFVEGLARGRFMVNVSFDSKWIFRMKGVMPEICRKLMHRWVRAAQNKKKTLS